jgi:hypothetical protein
LKAADGDECGASRLVEDAGESLYDPSLRQSLETLFSEPKPWTRGLTDEQQSHLESVVRLDRIFAGLFHGRYRGGQLDTYGQLLWSAQLKLAVLRAGIEHRFDGERLCRLKRALVDAIRDIKLPPSPVRIDKAKRFRPFAGAVYFAEYRDDRDETRLRISYGTPFPERGRPFKPRRREIQEQRILSRYDQLVAKVDEALIPNTKDRPAELSRLLDRDDVRRFLKAEDELRNQKLARTPARVAARMLSIEIQERLGGRRLSESAIKKLRPKAQRRSGPSGFRK